MDRKFKQEKIATLNSKLEELADTVQKLQHQMVALRDEKQSLVRELEVEGYKKHYWPIIRYFKKLTKHRFIDEFGNKIRFYLLRVSCGYVLKKVKFTEDNVIVDRDEWRPDNINMLGYFQSYKACKVSGLKTISKKDFIL